ncbi:MAG: hypothetical protein HYV26_17830 [Candidatus Hydrogenedentes bacterium]|nr:hypothetical protein [Candidatus Hydrogenedentota bacterium]
MKTLGLVCLAAVCAVPFVVGCEQSASTASEVYKETGVKALPSEPAPHIAEEAIHVAAADKAAPKPAEPPAAAPKPAPTVTPHKPVTAPPAAPALGDISKAMKKPAAPKKKLIDWTPAGTPIADALGEGDQLGALNGDYDAKVSVAKAADVPGGASAGQYAIKVESSGDSKSGVTNAGKGGLLDGKAGQNFEVAVRVKSEKALNGFVVTFSNSELGTIYATSKHNGRQSFGTQPGEWTTFAGQFSIPEGKGGPYALHVMLLEKGEATWYLDNVKIIEIGALDEKVTEALSAAPKAETAEEKEAAPKAEDAEEEKEAAPAAQEEGSAEKAAEQPAKKSTSRKKREE